MNNKRSGQQIRGGQALAGKNRCDIHVGGAKGWQIRDIYVGNT